MHLINLNCPNCGAPIQAEAGVRYTVCPYCSTSVMVDDGVQHVQYDNAEQAGYDFEKGRQRAQAEQRYYSPQYQTPRKKHTALWVLGWIFCFPIPLTILVVRSKKLNTISKAIIIVLVWAVFFALGIYGEKTDTASQTNNNEITTEQISESGLLCPFQFKISEEK